MPGGKWRNTKERRRYCGGLPYPSRGQGPCQRKPGHPGSHRDLKGRTFVAVAAGTAETS